MLRRSPRAPLLWLAALAVAAATAVTVATDLAVLHRRAASLGPEVAVAVAAHDLTLGTTLSDADLEARRVHRSQLPTGAVSPEAARNRVVAVSVAEHAFVVEGNLAPERRSGLDAVVPPGMRVVQVVVAGAETLRRGAAVDLLAAFDPAVDGAAVFDDGAVVAATGALVVAVGDAPVGPTPGAPGAALTVLVTDAEARTLTFAAANGVLVAALVPPEEARPIPPA